MSIQTVIFHPAYSILYLDMDGVVADFDKFVMDNLGRTFDHASGPGADQEMWDFLMTVPNLYYQLELTEYAMDLWHVANSLGCRVEFLTALPRRTTMPSAASDKTRWLKKHFGDNAQINFGPHSRDKVNHLKTYQIPMNPRVYAADVLLDDRKDNISSWNEAGGIGILHKYTNYEASKSKLLSLISH